ncbi:hypothetical protein K493DRAFT_319892 [Basidiobolus meristosporus CBS 931.73]|uniref:CBM1 domain-containing protein n=1 Tax=Basidiobolus meristosporus CBS 931.73 TaxID=1314790 RepID=A0A1Y1XJM3_9FUNG|nr:hypothetical protein K493DRAFT_319892 [Basidiobolus meristosporus CBS 931.73]|eukprot:ORX85957.1 hypothetical protein K493DRAFT_319892 [Basidiobolus meristosporus CBS 931.73]
MKFSVGVAALFAAVASVNAGYVGMKSQNGASYLWNCPGNPVPQLQSICASYPASCTYKAPISFTCTVLSTCNLLSGELISQNCTPTKV